MLADLAVEQRARFVRHRLRRVATYTERDERFLFRFCASVRARRDRGVELCARHALEQLRAVVLFRTEERGELTLREYDRAAELLEVEPES